jgi:outer membrane receptor protein involved in Fe transport
LGFACPSFAHEPNGLGTPLAAVSGQPVLPIFGGDLFATLRSRTLPLAATLGDPRSGAAIGRLDPVANSEMVEIGFRRHLPFGIESTVSMFRAASDLEVLLTGENAITAFSRPTVRQGVQAAARYEPASWLAIDLQATALHARFADGGAEYVPGTAERNASASATLRLSRGWRASLMLSYLGKRAGIDESSSLRASTFVDARLTRELSKSTRLSIEVPNLFDQRVRDVDYFSASRLSDAFGARDGYLFNPAEPRGVRLKLRTTF